MAGDIASDDVFGSRAGFHGNIRINDEHLQRSNYFTVDVFVPFLFCCYNVLQVHLTLKTTDLCF